jgi:glycogen(starch) synthase
VEKAGVPADVVRIVYEFIDTAQFTPVESNFRERFRISDGAPMVLFVAGLEPRKGPLVLTQAIPIVLSAIPEAKFVLIGRDTHMAPGGASMRGYIERTAQAQGFLSNLIFAGMVPTQDVVEAYSSCDVFVYPGLLEAGGLPPLEAMACNCPVVATATGVAAELGDVSPAFLLAKPGDPKALAAALIERLSQPKEDLREGSARHREIVEERFCFERMVNEILAVYEDAITR